MVTVSTDVLVREEEERERDATVASLLTRTAERCGAAFFCTCSFIVACADEGLEKFFGGALPSQLCPVEPYEQHPVSVFFIAVLACG